MPPYGKKLIYNAQTGEIKEENVDLDVVLADEFNVIADKTTIKPNGVDAAKFQISFNKSWKITDKRCLITISKDGAELTSAYITLNEDRNSYVLFGDFEFKSEVEGVYNLKFNLESFEKIIEVTAIA
jgi:hypothetical protein